MQSIEHFSQLDRHSLREHAAILSSRLQLALSTCLKTMLRQSSIWYIVSMVIVNLGSGSMPNLIQLDFYHMDYLEKPLSRRSSQRSQCSRSPPSARSSKRGAPKKLNFSFMEDPLLATMGGTSPPTALPLTPPADETTFSTVDSSSKLPDTPMVDQFSTDELEDELSEPEPDIQASHLVTHAKVYAIAEKYVSIFFFLTLPDYAPLHVGLLSFAPAVHLLRRLCCTACASPTYPAMCVTDVGSRLQSLLPSARSTARSSTSKPPVCFPLSLRVPITLVPAANSVSAAREGPRQRATTFPPANHATSHQKLER